MKLVKTLNDGVFTKQEIADIQDYSSNKIKKHVRLWMMLASVLTGFTYLYMLIFNEAGTASLASKLGISTGIAAFIFSVCGIGILITLAVREKHTNFGYEDELTGILGVKETSKEVSKLELPALIKMAEGSACIKDALAQIYTQHRFPTKMEMNGFLAVFNKEQEQINLEKYVKNLVG